MEDMEKNLALFGQQAARNLTITAHIRGAVAARHIGDSLRNVRRQYRLMSDKKEGALPKAAQWFLDNWYLAQRQGREAQIHFRQVKKLRRVEDTAFLLKASFALVKQQQGEISPEIIYPYFVGIQQVTPLSEEEISLLISALSAGLVFYLEELAMQLEDGATADLETKMEQVFSSLRLLTGLDMLNLLDDLSFTEQLFQKDPAGVYAEMDEKTRQRYRSTVSKIAQKQGVEEHEIARQVMQLAKQGKGKAAHVGYYLHVRPLGKEQKTRAGGIYIGGILVLSTFFALMIGAVLESLLVALLLLIPVSEIVKNLFDFFVIKFVRPRHVPRLALKDGVPEHGKTLCVISVLLDSEASGQAHAARLEEYYLANRDCGTHLRFGILADFPESAEAVLPEAEKWIDCTKAAIEGLSEKYQHDFYLFYREREQNPKTKRYMGYERKRGAILELARFLRGKPNKLNVVGASKKQLKNTVYVITLDSDTRLNIGAAREMIGAMMHPLHTPVVDEIRGMVLEGTALMQPRIGVELTAATKSDFSRMFAGLGGIDPYGSLSSDVYQDLFGEGSFAGKGIFDVKAFLACLDGTFPENWVLSHDLLEGAYLKTAYLGDIELTDGYPYKTLSYFARSHRWIRGDVQLLPWLFPRVKRADGKRVQNPLSALNRFKIFDNLRRSLVPVFTMIALTASMFVSLHSLFWAGVVATLTPLSALLISSADLIFRRDKARKQRYHSTIIAGFGGGFVQTLSQLILLPYQAYVHFSAICVAVWRMGVSRKNMLSWLVFSKSEQQTKTGLLFHYQKMLPAVLLGLAAMFFSGTPLKMAVGIVWIFSPIFAMSISRVRSTKVQMTKEQTHYLSECARDIWRYFADFLTAEDNYLPPDNWQEQPAVGIAHRTSPTNIGLAMMTVLAAVDLKLCPQAKAVALIENMMDSIQRMEKWEGHLYNWYDTRTLKPLYPRYVSAVDNGNLSGYLLVVREMLYEMGERELGKRVDTLYQNMGYEKLYDTKRNLFHIGYDLEKEELTEGWYDLLASEARQLSYIAIARGDVAARHWRRLGRALMEKNAFHGLASWSGSVFEYLMPNLIMPVYRDTLLYESAKFCVYAQKRRYRPWGVSESAFFTLDPSQSYSYKAHGVGDLALKRGMDKEKVIAPYATFLALPMDISGSVQNLQKLEALGAKGRYGFYEALDYTQNRRGKKQFALVKTYMAHHLGMSFLALHAVLTDHQMAKRFLRDRHMAAFSELLQEKVPIGQVVVERSRREIPEKPKRLLGQQWTRVHDGFSLSTPKVAVLSNGVYSVTVSDSGHSRSMAGENLMTRFISQPDGAVQGMGFYLQTDTDTFPLQAAPEYDAQVSCQAEFSVSHASLRVSHAQFQSEITLSLPQDMMGERRSVTLKNTTNEPMTGHLVFYAEPVMQRAADYFAHPAFAKLSMETSREENTLLVHRRSNGQRPDMYLALSVSEDFRFDTSRETAVGRSSLYAAFSKQSQGSLKTVLDPCLLIKVPVALRAGEEKQLQFSMVFGEKREEVLRQSKAVLAREKTEFEAYMEEKIHALKLGQSEWEKAQDLTAKIIYPHVTAAHRGQYITEQSKGGRALWPYGISGDLPLVTVKLTQQIAEGFLEKQLRQHNFLKKCGIQYDLVFLIADSGDYRRPAFTAVDDVLREMGLEHAKGEKAGIHLVENEGDLSAVYAASVEIYEDGQQIVQTSQQKISPYFDRSINVVNEQPIFSYTQKGEVQIQTKGNLPPNTWSHMLASEEFGFIATESGTGHMWQKNARENQITPWENDTLTTKGVERLTIQQNGEEISLFADDDGRDTTVTYGFGYAVWEKEIDGRKIKTTAFVPKGTDARVFIVASDLKEDVVLDYFATLKLGESEANRRYIITGEKEGLLWAKNGANVAFPETKVSLSANVAPIGYTTSRLSWSSRTLDEKTGAEGEPCFYTRYTLQKELVIVLGCVAQGHIKRLTNPEYAKKELEMTKAWWQDQVGQIQVQTGIENLDHLLSGWLLYQSLACRIFGRSSVYQSGGAYGFRDQLQDSTAVLAVNPEVTKNMLIEAAKHQFEEGDVMHWWHPSGIKDDPVAKGVRTRCSDDLLFLPYVLCEYVEKTGDNSICDTVLPYITSAPLLEEEHERYGTPVRSERSESLFLHAKRAVDMVLERGVGKNGLCLIGTGDWNDGMNLVGAKGKGESVWLSWFFAHVLTRFAHLCETMDEKTLAETYRKQAEIYGKAADSAWDGDWYLRGYYDNGATLGSHKDEECQIDAIAQGWSAMTQHSDPTKVKKAIQSAAKRLLDKENKLLQLFDPPFDKGAENPGYIRGYAPGLRENGGQYTHGVLWLSMGAFRAGLPDLGWEMLSAMLPGARRQDVYRGEPYVVAADVYANNQHKGRSGWTWYTGAAAWYFRVAMEEMLGLMLKDGKLYIKPNLPTALTSYRVRWGQWDIAVEKGNVTVNGKAYQGEGLPVFDENKQALPQFGKI